MAEDLNGTIREMPKDLRRRRVIQAVSSNTNWPTKSQLTATFAQRGRQVEATWPGVQ